jgi:hypothetical protein
LQGGTGVAGEETVSGEKEIGIAWDDVVIWGIAGDDGEIRGVSHGTCQSWNSQIEICG